MSQDSTGRVRALGHIPTWWPVGATIVGTIILAAQAYAQISDHDQRISDLEKAQPAIARELAAVNVGLARLEGKIDTLNERERTR